jgi:hypothetical protein
MIYALSVIIIALLIVLSVQQKHFHEHIENLTNAHHEHIVDLTKSWNVERSALLDRIQAPTFGEYKQAEIKMVKAQKDEEPKPSYILE